MRNSVLTTANSIGIVVFSFVTVITFGQASDSIRHRSHTWRSMALRGGVGLQNSFYYEAGVSFVFAEFDSKEGFGTGTLYAAAELVPSKNVYGIKIGGEFGQNLSMAGLELKSQSNGTSTDFVITPKIGLGLGLVNLFYGYNISTNNYPFQGIRESQFSFVFNFTKKFFGKAPGAKE